MPKPKPRQPPATYRKPPPDRPETAAAASGGWLWGRHAVLAALANPERRRLRLVLSAEAAAELSANLALAKDVHGQIAQREEFQRLLPPGAVHQGFALQAGPLPAVAIEDIIERAEGAERALIVALDQVSDPHNVGAVLRSAAAFGAVAVIVPERNAPEMSGVLAKAASGAAEHVPVIRVVNLVRTLEQLREAGFWSVGLDGGAERTLASHRLTGKLVLVLGSEGDGLRRLTREKCDLMARLPISGPIPSLNVSNAAAIALYELTRE